ncbi:hypothetical protein UNH65_05815 [Chitinophaga sp. 180180018-2]|nr:hypothetical protein [Chitinophaga sp. 212800010-3]
MNPSFSDGDYVIATEISFEDWPMKNCSITQTGQPTSKVC